MKTHHLALALAAALAAMAPPADAASPYAAMTGRDIKALSDRQVDDLLAGRGMGMALPAELNRYPGPVHVLELADGMDLSAGQRTEIQALYEAMQAEARPLGRQVLDREAELDRLFAEGRATPQGIADVTAAIGDLQGRLRFVHLKYHIRVRDLLTHRQLAAYQKLRGYDAGGQARQGHGQGHRHQR